MDMTQYSLILFHFQVMEEEEDQVAMETMILEEEVDTEAEEEEEVDLAADLENVETMEMMIKMFTTNDSKDQILDPEEEGITEGLDTTLHQKLLIMKNPHGNEEK